VDRSSGRGERAAVAADEAQEIDEEGAPFVRRRTLSRLRQDLYGHVTDVHNPDSPLGEEPAPSMFERVRHPGALHRRQKALPDAGRIEVCRQRHMLPLQHADDVALVVSRVHSTGGTVDVDRTGGSR
jgi:hypothetical protein